MSLRFTNASRRRRTPLLITIDVCDLSLGDRRRARAALTRGFSRSEFEEKLTVARKSPFISQYIC
ncbi:hypothetical protein GGE45_006127 [Rhizobium aethiopicum]|uniref:Uncharacterized protein n=1 Tax=Rhizobium aethiopicum TaxID=1138170 RepID=A0A7W6QE21_9HYPH|nr:hypothetical protein [Rhizobium aethiopicum]MBB4195820.1 hypothetical protein [Rhizobium aethiopicum]MBB4583748.1 hypothetical protein [Rhizobium aethiopicum]